MLGGNGGLAGNVNTTRRKKKQARPNSRYKRFIISLLILPLKLRELVTFFDKGSTSVTNCGPMTKLIAVPT